MPAKILPFRTPGAATLTPVSYFVRIGAAHKQLAALHAAGHLPARHAVIDASRLRHQRELVSALRDSGTQIILDTEAAELAAPARCGGHSRHAPWALEGGKPLMADQFIGSSLERIAGEIARFAVQNRTDAILAPTHYLGDPACSDWLIIDKQACLLLRRALDREGGEDIMIDYPLILPNTMLNDAGVRGRISAIVGDLPVENVWIRSSGFGSDAGPFAAKRFLTSISGFHNLGKPLIADYLGGLVGQAALAFGAVSGTATGISERERFDARGWHKVPQEITEEDTRFGREIRITIPDLHRSLTVKELDVLATAKSGKRICGCGDRSCCLNGFSDMMSDHRGHATRQAFRAVEAIEKVPDALRETFFLEGPMATARRKAREIRGLKPSATEAIRNRLNLEDLMKRLTDHNRKLDKLSDSLQHLHESRGDDAMRARPVRSFKPRDKLASQKRP